MKKLLLILATFTVGKMAYAQSIEVMEQMTLFSVGSQNALITNVYQNDKEDVVSKWKDYLKDFKNEKVKFENNELFGDNILIKEWGNNPVDIYALFEENKSNKSVKMMVAFNLGGLYLSSQNDTAKFVFARKLVKDFAVKTTKQPYEEKLKIEEKTLSTLEGDQKNLEKENKGLHEDIESYKSKIAKAEDDIKKNEEKQKQNQSRLGEQKAIIDQLKVTMEGVK